MVLYRSDDYWVGVYLVNDYLADIYLVGVYLVNVRRVAREPKSPCKRAK